MSSAWLADLGAASVAALWLPVLAWTALALGAEAALRLGRASARLGLGVRGAVVAALPGLLVVPPVLARWVPSFRPASGEASALPLVAPGPAATLDLEALLPPDLAWMDVLIGGATLGAGLVAVFGLGALIGGLVWLGRYRRGLAVAADPVVAEAREVAGRLGVRQSLAVAVAEPGSAPFTVGWRKPLVAVPADLEGESLRLALAHELAHVREAHYGWSLAERVVRAGFAWHPAVHALGRGLALDRERAADAAVVRLWPQHARSYGHLLISVASRPSPSLALGASSSTLVYRLTAMTHLRPDRVLLARLIGAALLVVPLGLSAAAVPDAPALPASALAPADTTDHAFEISVWRDGGVPSRVEIRMDAGTTLEDAVAVADRYSNGSAVSTLVVIAASGERITRSTLNLDIVPLPPPPPSAAPPPPPAPPLPPGFQDDALLRKIGAFSVWKPDAAPQTIRIQMKPGTTRTDAARVADYFSEGGDTPATLIVTDASGQQIRRSTVRSEAVPPPPPPPPPPAPQAPNPPTPPAPPAPPAPPPPPAPPAPPTGVRLQNVDLSQTRTTLRKLQETLSDGEFDRLVIRLDAAQRELPADELDRLAVALRRMEDDLPRAELGRIARELTQRTETIHDSQ